MIGPHEGRELDLMLTGKKFLAAFGDIVPPTGQIDEAIIPEQKFSPYVKNGALRRFEKQLFSGRLRQPMLYVCFVIPGHEWRAETFFGLREMVHSGEWPADDATDIIIGRLLGYSQEDIDHFIHKSKER